MLALHGGNKDGELILFVLEPGNLEKLKRGEPIHKYLSEFIPSLGRKVEMVIAYTPDIDWVVEQIGKSRDMETIAMAIHESLSRETVVRDSKSAEDMKRVF
jgi:hypothetical protein